MEAQIDDISLGTNTGVDGLQELGYLKEFGDIYKRLDKRLKPCVVN